MKSKLSLGIACTIVICLVTICMIPNALASSNSTLLSSISVENGKLSPSFHPNSYEYLVAPDIGYSSVTVTVTPEDSGAAIQINDNPATSIVLSTEESGVDQAAIVVTSADGLQTRNYSISLTPRTSNADIASMNVFSDVLSPSFDPAVLNYTLTSQRSTYCTLSVSVADPFASVSINGESGKTTAQIQYNSTSYPDTATIIVTAADGVTQKTYQVTATQNSSNADLKSISINNGFGVLSPSFNSATTTYYVVPNSPMSFVDLIITLMDSRGSIKVNGRQVNLTNSQYSYRLGYESSLPKSAVIEVTASNGVTKKTYTVYFAINRTTASVSPVDYQSVKVSWSPVTDATGYIVYRSTSINGTYSKLRTCSSSTLSYTNTGLSTGNTYYYKVKAYNNSWGTGTVYSDYSEPVSAKPALSAVSSCTASAVDPVKVKVSWSSVSGRTRYEVWRSDNGGAYTLLGTTTSTSYSSTGLTPFHTYSYYIRVYRTVSGNKIYAAANSPVASAKPVLGSVTNGKAAMASASSVKLTWNSVSGASGYEVRRWDAASGKYVVVASTTRTYYTHSDLVPNVSYTYEVAAYRTVGSARVYSTACTPVSATPYFGAVTNVKAAMASASSVKLTWSAVSGASGYEVRRWDAASGKYIVVTSTTRTYYTNTSLPPNVSYTFQVAAYRTVGSARVYSTACTPVSATPTLGGVTNAKAVRSSATKIKLTWNAVSGRTGYDIFRSATPDGTFVSVGTTTRTYYYNSGLTTGTPYYYIIKAYVTVNGVKYYGGASAVVTATP